MDNQDWQTAPEWQLSWYDLADRAVAIEGVPLVELLGQDLIGTMQPLSAHPYPEVGWRLIVGEQPIPVSDAGVLSVLAAPWPVAGPSQWAMINVTHNNGKVWLTTMGWETLRPGRVRRRWGLELGWPEPVVEHRTGTEFSARMILRNVSLVHWYGDGRDFDGLDVTVERADRQPWPRYRPSGGSRIERLPPLPIQSSIDLTVRSIGNADARTLPAGEYRLDAQLWDMQLHAPTVRLVVAP